MTDVSERTWICNGVTLPVYALSYRQPWAWLVTVGPKDVENRTRLIRKGGLGPHFVHASGTMSLEEYEDAALFVRQTDPSITLPKPDALLLGGIVGMADSSEVLPRTYPPTRPWHMTGQVGFVLKDRRPLPYVRCRGSQGFWRVLEEVRSELRTFLRRP